MSTRCNANRNKGLYNVLHNIQSSRLAFRSIKYLHKLIILNCLLAKTIAYFVFTPHFYLWLHIMSAIFINWMKPSGIRLHIYSDSLSVFLEYRTRGFYRSSGANLILLLTFVAWIHVASLTFIVIPRNTWLGADFLFIKLEFGKQWRS